MTARPPISDAALRDRLDSFLQSRNPADVNRLNRDFELTVYQERIVDKWSLAHMDIRKGKESERVTAALMRVGELIAAGMSANAARIIAAKEFGYKAESLRKARTRRAARLRT